MKDADDSEKLAEQIDQIADEFDRAWRNWANGPPPSIRAFLDQAEESVRSSLREELLAIDREYRAKHGLSSSSLGWINTEAAGSPTAVDLPQPEDSTDITTPADVYKKQTPRRGPDIAIGQSILGKYKVIEELGAGGEATTYRALHSSLGRDVVLKIGHEPCDPKRLAMDDLAKEARALAHLDHPDIARVHDVDVYEDYPFLVLELVRGRNLQQFRLGGPHPSRLYARILARVARALDAAHRMGIVHQDLTPRNVLVTVDNEPKLIDFGMAMIRAAGFENASRIGGTPPYLSPEQALGDRERIGPRTDIFGLGAILYFLLVGRPLYAGGSLTQNLELAAKANFDMDALNASDVPRPLAQICRKALQRDPADRFERAGQMARALEAYVHRPRVYAAGACAAAATLGLIGYFLWPKRPQLPPGFEAGLEVRVNQGSPKSADFVPLDLAYNPIATGDQLQFHFRQPAGFAATLFLLDSEGVACELATYPPPPRDGSVIYPGEGRAVPMTGKPGTELLLLCLSAGSLPSLADIEAAWPDPATWAAIPAWVTIHLDRDKVWVDRSEKTKGVGNEEVIDDPASRAVAHLERFRQTLNARDIAGVFGLAFPHCD